MSLRYIKHHHWPLLGFYLTALYSALDSDKATFIHTYILHSTLFIFVLNTALSKNIKGRRLIWL